MRLCLLLLFSTALQDVLAARGDVVGLPPEEPGDLDMLLEHWPENVAALEYFLGSEHAWLFLIDTGGTVSVYALKDERGEPVASRRLVAQVTQFLSGLNLYADKMRRRLMAGRGFQHRVRVRTHGQQRHRLTLTTKPDDSFDNVVDIQTTLPYHARPGLLGHRSIGATTCGQKCFEFAQLRLSCRSAIPLS